MKICNSRRTRALLATVLVAAAAFPVGGTAEVVEGALDAYVNSGGCEVEFVNVDIPNPTEPGQTITVTRASCKDVSCDGVCVLHRRKNDPDHLWTACYCDWPNVNGEGPELRD